MTFVSLVNVQNSQNCGNPEYTDELMCQMCILNMVHSGWVCSLQTPFDKITYWTDCR